MKSKEEVREVVLRNLQSVAPDADVNTLQPSVDMREALDLDSLDFLRFVSALHKELGVAIPESDYPSVTTLNGCIDYLARAA